MSKSAMIATLRNLFPTDDNGIAKSEVLYDLAREARDGCIVEVGAGRGVGSIALAYGTVDGHNLPLYCVDPFTPVRGWANEPYDEMLRKEWYRNVSECGLPWVPRLVSLPIQLFEPIQWPDLTFWDLGQRMSVCGRWLDYWTHITVQHGGIVAINETGGNDLGVDDWIAQSGLLYTDAILHRIRITRRM